MNSKGSTRFLGNRPVSIKSNRPSSDAVVVDGAAKKIGASASLLGEDSLLDMLDEEEDFKRRMEGDKATGAAKADFVPASQVRTSERGPSEDNENHEELLESSRVCPRGSSSSFVRQRRGSRKVTVTSHHDSTVGDDERTLSSQEKLEMRYWGLPELVLMRYGQKGIKTMFHWQAECLGIGEVLEGGNLVYSAPTSAGKTLVAEMLMVKRVLETRKKAIIILPFVSLAREKMFGLQALLQDLPVRVHGFMGSQAPAGGLKRADIAVCTIEKANSLINRLLESRNDEVGLESIGCIVVDELHLLGDPSRGYLLELLLTKVRYMSWNIQIIGMSATLPNLELLAVWLDADLYKTDFRPVPLAENIKIGRRIYDSGFQFLREIHPPFAVEGDSDNLVYLCLETVLCGHSVLVFCPTKNWCEKLAETVAKEFFNLGRGRAAHVNDPVAVEDVRQRIQGQLSGQRLSEVLEQLRRCPAGLDPALAKVVGFGVAYHHAGLTFDERDILEGAFKQSALRVLIATSTLSSGVNLPARRVIVRCPFTFQNQLIDTLSYKQMVGRAGRKGIDTEGESILLCREHERPKVEELVTASLKPVESCLITQQDSLGSAMKRAILEVVASGAASTPSEVEKYASCTMLAASLSKEGQSSQATTDNVIAQCVKFLEENEFIRLQSDISGGESMQARSAGSGPETRYVATQLGLACLASSLSPDEGLRTLVELRQARKCFVLENELHLVYLVVPIYAAVSWPNLDWRAFLSLWEELPADMKRVAELVGVEERFLVRAMRGTIGKTERQERQLGIHQRFYTALALHDLVNEVPLSVVSQKYGSTKGMLQSLQQAASTFAGMVTAFCHKLGWYNLELLLGQFQDRLQFGVQRELIDLCRLTTLNGQRARTLHKAGVDGVAALANCTATQVEDILHNAAPFESRKQGEGESAYDARRRADSRCFWVTGRKGMTYAEAAEEIVREARQILQRDLMLEPGAAVDWGGGGLGQMAPASGGRGKRSKAKGPKQKGARKGKRKPTSSFSKRPPNTTVNNSAQLSRVKPSETSKPTKRPSSEFATASNPVAIVKAARTSLEHDSPREKLLSPSKVSTPATECATPTLPASSGKRLETSAFDMSGQLDEIFEAELDDVILSNSTKRAGKLSAQHLRAKVEQSSSPVLRDRTNLKVSFAKEDEEEDVFGESLDGSAIDALMKQQCADGKRSDSTVDTSCPKTPAVRVSHADGKALNLGATTTFSDLSEGETSVGAGGTDKKSPSEDNKRESVDIIETSFQNPANLTLSDSFLERAMETHMSAAESEEDAKADEKASPKKRSITAEDSTLEKKPFLRPSPLVKAPASSTNSPASRTPKSNRVSTPSSARSQRIAARRRLRGDAAGSQKSKISPGLLILSDSDSDCLQSPGTPQTRKAATQIQSACSSLKVVDVCADRTLFDSFANEWKQQDIFALAIACTKDIKPADDDASSKQGIGARVTRKRRAQPQPRVSADPDLESLTLSDLGVSVTGIAVSWPLQSSGEEEERGTHVAYFLPLVSSATVREPNDTLAPPTQDTSISLDDKITLARDILADKNTVRRIVMFDAKEHFKVAYLALGISMEFGHDFIDPKVAMWMLHPGDRERNLPNVVMTKTPWLSPLLPTLGSAPGYGSVALCAAEGVATAPRSRACAEAAIVCALWPKLEAELDALAMTKTFRSVEMRSLMSLARMELNGVGFDLEESERQRQLLVDRLTELEEEAYALAGHPFSLTSPEETCQVLYRELRLPVNGEPGHRWLGTATRSGGGRKAGAPSSSKEVLIKLKGNHKLPGVILDWRKLNMAISKTVYPMQRAKMSHPWLETDRIYTRCNTLSSTGRISLHEPNIQNIPRDFEIGGKPVTAKDASFSSTLEAAAAMKSLSTFFGEEETTNREDASPSPVTLVSMRHAVVPSPGFLILAADYSQLELRILAHLSGDNKLKGILNAGRDVFKSIASRWKRVGVEEISDEERQQAKQICYGMIYGIGTKSLGEQLGVIEEDAALFLSDFKSAYPDVKRFMEQTLVECRKRGYVETMHGRRRYLPKITGDANHFARAAAERQAINTAVQGSAADLVKSAMTEIDRRLFRAFPHCARPLRPSNRPESRDRRRADAGGAYFALQMHDELLYEVAAGDALQVAKIVKMVMENACRLGVVTPVKVKVGASWGQLKELDGLLN